MKSDGRRVKLLAVSGELICDLFRKGKEIRKTTCVEGLPDDATVVGSEWNEGMRCALLWVESQEFDVVADGHSAPWCEVRFSI